LQAGDQSVLNVCDSLFNTFDISVCITRPSDPSVTSSYTTLQSQGTHTFFTQMEGQYLKNAITRKLALYKYALYLLTTYNTFTVHAGFTIRLGYIPQKQ